MTKFAGFEVPDSNFFRVPNSFFNINNLSPHERVVLLYILRHTWGYQEYGIHKTITIDEFQNGRKYRNGSRMDEGVGLSRGGIHGCLKSLAEKGYINVDTDSKDLARVRKSYCLNMAQDSIHEMNTEFAERTQSSSGEPGIHEVNTDGHDVNAIRERNQEIHIEKETKKTPTPGAAVEKVRPNLFTFYEGLIGPLTGNIGEMLKSWLGEYPERWCEEALTEAKNTKARLPMRYAAKILERWFKDGYNGTWQQTAAAGNNMPEPKKLTEAELLKQAPWLKGQNEEQL